MKFNYLLKLSRKWFAFDISLKSEVLYEWFFRQANSIIKDLAMDGGLFPSVLQVFVRPLCEQLSLPQRKHLRWFLFGIVMSVRSSKLQHVAQMAPAGGHRTSCGLFLRSQWDSVGLLQQRALEILSSMKPQKHEHLYLIIDDTRTEKRGRKMEAVSKIYDHKTQRFIHGHQIVAAAILFRGVVLPWRFQIWIPKASAGQNYQKTTHIAAAIINEFQLPWNL